ncbi:P2Y purinoceptor 1-like [Ambystoma mexicanum]|uniref:P2Y purinoceptor 1-like n=1 Tax=Ambystoma mexicanum TaxID=8296 RepID=UPI0037E78E3A
MQAGNSTESLLTTAISNLSVLPCQVNKGFTFHYLPAVYLTVFLAGILGNGLGLWNLCVNWKKWNSLNVLVCNLGVADLLYVITLPFFASYYIRKEVWVFGLPFCRVARCLFHVNLYASIGFLTCISVQRYLGIVHPMKMLGRFQTLRHSFLVSAVVWIWVIIQILPDLVFMKTDNNTLRCYDSTGNDSLSTYLPYSFIMMVTGFLIPFMIIIGCYSHVLVVLWKNKNIDPALKERSVKLVIIVMVLFSVCFFPYHLFRALNLLSRVWQLQGICSQTLNNIYVTYQVTRGLACMNSAINPLVYLVTNENFVSKLRKFRKQAWQTCFFLKMGRMEYFSERIKLKTFVNEEQREILDEQ